MRHKSGRYYARVFANNKEIWKNLDTYHFSILKARLAEFLREQKQNQVVASRRSSAKMTFGQPLAIHLQNLDDDKTIKPTIRHYSRQISSLYLRAGPGWKNRMVRGSSHNKRIKYSIKRSKTGLELVRRAIFDQTRVRMILQFGFFFNRSLLLKLLNQRNIIPMPCVVGSAFEVWIKFYYIANIFTPRL